MSLRNVTLTAVAALSFGMAAHAQTTTITVPLTEPGATAPAPAGPGTTVTVTDGAQTVTTTPSAPAPAAVEPATPPAVTTTAPVADAAPAATPPGVVVERGASAPVTPVAPTTAEPVPAGGVTPASPGATADAATSATAEVPAKAADPAEAAATTETGTAATEMSPATPTATPTAGEPPAAPGEGLPSDATAAQVDAPVPVTPPVTGDAAPATATPAEPAAAAPAADAPAAPATETAVVPAEEAPAAIQSGETAQVEPAATDTGAATEAAAPADGHAAPAEEAAPAHAPHQVIHDVAFSFEGPFGKYDQFQLQRGLQVYTEVCAGCHGMKQVPLRTLHDAGGPGLPEDQVRAYAAAMSVMDPETGEERPRLPTDFFPTVSGDGMGPDLSLMAKARAGFHGPYGTGISQFFRGIGGPEYIYSILTGYTGETKEQAGTTFYENHAFPGGWISMPPPLADDQVTFEDGSPADLHSAAKDISAFLMWTAEPKMMARKQAGLVSVLFLIVLSALLYLTNKRIWWPIKHRDDVPGDGR